MALTGVTPKQDRITIITQKVTENLKPETITPNTDIIASIEGKNYQHMNKGQLVELIKLNKFVISEEKTVKEIKSSIKELIRAQEDKK